MPAVKTKPKETSTIENAIELMKANCLELSFTVHGLPKSRKISGKMADQIASAVKGKKKGVKANWSMFTSDHPYVKELNSAIRDLEQLREDYTIVRSPEAVKGEEGSATVERGKRLIWVSDVEEFHKLFVKHAKNIDAILEKVQFALNNPVDIKDASGNRKSYPSIKDMDRENAGDAWAADAYPENVTLTAGVAKERNADGTPELDENGDPKYVVKYDQYTVSEKLSANLQRRAYERLDKRIAADLETGVTNIVGKFTDELTTFMDELVTRTVLRPKATDTKYGYLTEHGDCERVKLTTRDQDAKIPEHHVKVYVRYTEKDGDEFRKVSKWIGPISTNEYGTRLNPETTGQKKKLYPQVIEGIIANMQVFRDKKAKMLGDYGTKMFEAFEPLLKELTKHKGMGTNLTGATKLAAQLKADDADREDMARQIADTIEKLEEMTVVVKADVQTRRSISKKRVMAVNDDD